MAVSNAEKTARSPGTVLVTGASSGIGYELAREFAERGHALIVCAEDADIEQAAERLRAAGAERVQAVQEDLRRREGVERLWATVTEGGRPLTVAVLNAGVGQGGPFIENDLDDELGIVELNITSTLRLAKRVLADMAGRGEGRVLISSSIAAMMPGSFQAVYNASKSFLQSFALAVRNELAGTGVTVTSLMPGPTETEFFERADMLDTKVGQSEKDDPVTVARQGYEALLAGKDKVVTGSLKTRAQAAAGTALPDSAKAQAHRRMAEPGSGEER
ncbi:SDR family NAD(P)-dependent oxidoreductase [Streptomyces tubbatahanensis]|uniref:SDR family NAD(P)-dependent oxidoreductase n=1 Tax=Streptomyces tubbatahanensis TaxID=2923272 RepID=A0ABY3Y0W8_9ACTN|nr:SDR family NAD(P)-dependent oxidoreductase [Streptomyces tubbatahanensis]UNT00269.1 SDR family NAD(P)-dependent oxidoreductase [Streptomyces tubbatahanensis]